MVRETVRVGRGRNCYGFITMNVGKVPAECRPAGEYRKQCKSYEHESASSFVSHAMKLL